MPKGFLRVGGWPASVPQAARKIGCTPEQYVAMREAGNRWCAIGRHWIPKSLMAPSGNYCRGCVKERGKKEKT